VRTYIHQQIGKFIKNNLENLAFKCCSYEFAAFFASLMLLKDDVVIKSEKRGKGVQRYKNSFVSKRNVSGTYIHLECGEFYKKSLVPIKYLIDSLLTNQMPLLLSGKITFCDIQNLFVDVNHEYYNIWKGYTEFANIDMTKFRTPLLITPSILK
jgi:hypothetical protein